MKVGPTADGRNLLHQPLIGFCGERNAKDHDTLARCIVGRVNGMVAYVVNPVGQDDDDFHRPRSSIWAGEQRVEPVMYSVTNVRPPRTKTIRVRGQRIKNCGVV